MLQNTIKILLVDDDVAAVDTLAEELSGQGYTVETAYKGAHALDHVRGDVPPDVVVLAMSMPEMDGFTILRAIKTVRQHTQVIMLSDDAPDFVIDIGENLQSKAMRMGAMAILKRPIEAEDIVSIMGISSSQHMESTLVAASLAEGGAFTEADDVLSEADALAEVERRLKLEAVM